MFDFLGDMIDGIFGTAEDAVDGAFEATEGVVNGVMGTTEAIIGGTVNAASSIIDTTVKVGLPIIKTAGELYIGGMISPALGAIPGPVGGIANVYDAADTIRGTFSAIPDTLKEIDDNFDDTD